MFVVISVSLGYCDCVGIMSTKNKDCHSNNIFIFASLFSFMIRNTCAGFLVKYHVINVIYTLSECRCRI